MNFQILIKWERVSDPRLIALHYSVKIALSSVGDLTYNFYLISSPYLELSLTMRLAHRLFYTDYEEQSQTAEGAIEPLPSFSSNDVPLLLVSHVAFC